MKVFFDTNLFIYLWEGRPSPAKERIERILRILQQSGGSLATSTLTLAEILVHPVRQGAGEAVRAYVERFERLDLIPFDATCSVRFAEIRARHPAVKPPDAIQLACASRARCDWFLTSDRRLTDLEISGIDRCGSYEDFQ